MSNLKYTDVMKPEDISVAHCWNTFAGFVLEPQHSAIQRSEMRKAFYAGFSECFKITVDMATELTVEQSVAVLDRLSKECDEYVEKMLKEAGL